MNNEHSNEQSKMNTNSTEHTQKETSYTYGPNRSYTEMKSNYEKQLEMFTASSGDSSGYGAGIGGGMPTTRKKRPSSSKMVAAFLVGAIVIGGFMYTADQQNLFTGGQGSGTIMNGKVSDPAQQAAGVKTASASVEADIADIYAAASPAVVKIENYTEPARASNRGSEYWQFFGQQMPQQQQQDGYQNEGRDQQQQQETQPETDSSELELSGSGTGFIFESSGYILTNEHVVADAKQVKVTVEGYDEPFVATVVGASAEQDLAVLKIEGSEAFTTIELGDSDQTVIGEWVIAIGNPYGFDHTMTVGVLSAKERPITISDESGEHVYEHLLQTDASINPGNSGGPLLNAKGEVIGINTAVNSEAQGIGFAIPTSTIQEVLEQIMSK
ncbi:MAG: S1C family serine protease [Candidatus Pristimantibacillus sp.]